MTHLIDVDNIKHPYVTITYPDGQMVQVKLTHEGVILDVYERDGEVTETQAKEWHEFFD